MSINISHLEKLYIENKGYLDSLSSDELKKLIDTTLYRRILTNIFEKYIREGEISEEEYYSIKSNNVVLDIIDYFFLEREIEVKEEKEIISNDNYEGLNELLASSPLKYYINTIPNKLLSPREERYLFKKLSSEKNKIEILKQDIINSKQSTLDEIASHYKESSYKAKIENLKKYMSSKIDKYDGKEDFDTYFEQIASEFASHLFTSFYFVKRFPKTKDEIIKDNTIEEKNIKELVDSYMEHKKKYEEVYKKIATSNLRLVLWVVRNLVSNTTEDNIEDIIQDGNEGLLNAITAYDLNKGVAFASYAVYWIKKAISDNNANNQRFKIPKSKLLLCSKITDYIDKCKKENGNTPSLQDISKEFGIKTSTARQLLIFNQETVSLDSKVESEDEDERLLGELIEDETQNVEESYFRSALQESTYEELKKINPKIRLILMLRLGFIAREPELLNLKDENIVINSDVLSNEEMGKMFKDLGIYEYSLEDDYNDGLFHKINKDTSYIYLDGEEHTLQEVADIFGVTHQRVSKIEKEGYGTLRLAIHSNKFKDFYE